MLAEEVVDSIVVVLLQVQDHQEAVINNFWGLVWNFNLVNFILQL
jgi:hypothetical protein